MALWNRVWNLVRGDQHRSDLDEELAFHVDMRTRANEAGGMPEPEAVRQARLSFGNVTLERERARDAGVVIWLDSLLQDVRYALRGIRTSRAVAVLIVAALALGVGANTAIFTITNALIFRLLPVKDPAHLVNVRIGNFQSWGYIEATDSFTYALWTDFMKRQDVLDGSFAYADVRLDAVLTTGTRPVIGAFMSPPGFRTLGVDPVLGRTFTESDEQPVVVISYGLWEREYASNPDVIGRPLTIEGKPFTIIGVMPPRFFGMTVGHVADYYLPIAAEPYIRGGESALQNGIRYWLVVFGRLRPGISPEVARQRLAAISRLSMQATLPSELPQAEHPDYLRQNFILRSAESGISYARGELEYPLAVLAVVAGLLLLLACFTVANLLLARATARQKEIAVRVSLGASRSRIARQVFVESILLALAGAVAGLIVARIATLALLDSYMNTRDPLMLDLSTDWTVFAFALGSAVLSALVFGIAPALRAAQTAPAELLKAGTGAGSSTVLHLRRFLLAAQVAVAVVLVSGAVLFGTTLRNLLTADRGFDSSGVIIAEVDLRRMQLSKEALPQFYAQLLERMQRVPAVASASLSYVAPVSGGTWQFNVNALTASGPKDVHIHFNGVSPEFFRTFGTTILSGRGLTRNDGAGAPSVVVVNPAFAQIAFGTPDVIGQRLMLKDPEPRTLEIVGIVQNAKYRNLRQSIPPTVYAPIAQYSMIPPSMSLALRSRGSAAALVREVRSVLGSEYPNLSFEVNTMNTLITRSVAQERAFAFVCSLFGVLALALAAIGVYGVLSYLIARRRSEIGIRLALGATPANVRRLIYSQSLATCAAGAVVGCVVGVWAARFTGAMLYGITPAQPSVYIGAMLILAAVAVVATVVPAVRASRTEPMNVLRCE